MNDKRATVEGRNFPAPDIHSFDLWEKALIKGSRTELCVKKSHLSPMKTMSFSLNDGQADELISYILDTYGPALNRVDFSDATCLALEDVSGFETPDAKELALLRTKLWTLYQEH